MGHYYYHKDGDNLFVRMQGKMKYTSSVGFDKFVAEFSSQDLDSVLVDLQNVEYIDSTNLGLIAKMAEYLDSRNKQPLTILSTNQDINEVLSSLGFDQVCTIISTSPGDIDYDAIPVKTGTERDLLKMMVDAHRRLISLSEDNAAIFKDVVELMEKDISDRA